MSLGVLIVASLIIGALLALIENHRFKKRLSSFDKHRTNLESLNKRLELILEKDGSKDLEDQLTTVDSSNQAVDKLMDSYKLILALQSHSWAHNPNICAYYSNDFHVEKKFRARRKMLGKSDSILSLVMPHASPVATSAASKATRVEGYISSPLLGYNCLVA